MGCSEEERVRNSNDEVVKEVQPEDNDPSTTLLKGQANPVSGTLPHEKCSSITCPHCGKAVPLDHSIQMNGTGDTAPETGPGAQEAAARNSSTLTLHGTAPAYEVLTKGERHLILASLLISRFIIVLDTTIVAVAIPSILKDLGEAQYLSWLVAAYLITSCSFQPITGRLSDVVGRRWLYLGSLAIFLIASAVCGAATTFWFLAIARVFQGIGGGCLAALTLVVGGDITAPKDRPKIFGLLGSTAGFGAVTGPVLGGILTEWVTWRSIFYVNVPIVAICFVIAFIGMKKLEVAHKKLPLDWVGSLLALFACVTFILFVTWGGNDQVGYAWDSAVIICLIWATAFLILLFIIAEQRHPLPILPFRLFKIRNFWVCCLVILFVFMTMLPNSYYLAIYFQEVVGDSAVISGAKILGFSCGFFVGLILSRKFVTASWVRYLMSGSSLLTIAGTLILVFLARRDTNYGIIFIAIVSIGVGIGFQIPATGTLVQMSVEQRDIAVAMSAYSFASLLGGTIGITIAGAAFNNAYSNNSHLSHLDATSKGVSAVFILIACTAGVTCLLGLLVKAVKQEPKAPKAPNAQQNALKASDVQQSAPNAQQSAPNAQQTSVEV